MPQLTDNAEYQAFVRFLDLTLEARALRDRLNEIIPQIKALQPTLLAYLGANNLRTLAVREFDLIPHREPWIYPATGVTRQQVCDALKSSGLKRMVSENYSTQSLTKYVKDLESHHRLTVGLNGRLENILPAPLASVLAVKPAYSVRIRKKATPLYTENTEDFFKEEEQGDHEHE